MNYIFNHIKFILKSIGFYFPSIDNYTINLLNFVDKFQKKVIFFNSNLIKYPVTANYYLYLDKHSYYTDLILQDFEHIERMLTGKLLKKKGHFIDVGANIGLYSIIASSLIDDGLIYAFEPSSMTYNKLVYNILLNKISNIKSFKLALSDEDNPSVTLYKNPKGFELFDSLIKPDRDYYSEELVQTTSLDAFILKNAIQINEIQFIKIDVEGVEYEVLMGATSILKNGKHIIFLVEFNHDYKDESSHCNKVFMLFKQYNFSCYEYLPKSKVLADVENLKNNFMGNFFVFHDSNIKNIGIILQNEGIKLESRVK